MKSYLCETTKKLISVKIFSAVQLMEADRLTIKKQGISSDALMERAATLVFEGIHGYTQKNKPPVKIFCGIGNNGGDGLVIARLLLNHGYEVSVFIVNYSEKRTEDFLLNYQRLTEISDQWPVQLTDESAMPEIKKGDLIVDAIFGVGLNRPLAPWVAKIISHINKSGTFVLSVDMPSGMFDAKPKKEEDVIIKATTTFTFQSPKLPFYLPETGKFVGNLIIFDIGLDPEFLAKTQTSAHLIGKHEAARLYKPREKFSHKGTYGHALMVGGSYGKMGSICLGSTAALKSGAGMLTAFIPKCGYSIVQTLLPEAMAITDEAENHLSQVIFDFEPSVVCFGVGAGQHPETLLAFEKLLEKTTRPMLIDADGLNLLSENKGLLKKIPKHSILTPHPKELERLVGSWNDDFEKLDLARKFAQEHQVILIIKGAHSITIAEKQIYINTSGNPGMATAGSGDVLSGVITGLLSQGYDPLTAAIFGVYLHGKAGDIGIKELGFEGLIAGDIAASIGPAFLSLFKSAAPNEQKQ